MGCCLVFEWGETVSMVIYSWVNIGLKRILFCSISKSFLCTVILQAPSSFSSSTLPLTFISSNQTAAQLNSTRESHGLYEAVPQRPHSFSYLEIHLRTPTKMETHHALANDNQPWAEPLLFRMKGMENRTPI